MKPLILTRENGAAIAYHHTTANVPSSKIQPGVLFCGGFKSDMAGVKATTLQAFCNRRGQQYTRFDYQGHGASSGNFVNGSIGDWRGDMLDVFDQVTEGSQIVVGSSMGGWMALMLALARPTRVRGLVLIAPAADFTDALMWPSLPEEARRQIETEGVWLRPSIYDDGPYPITRHLIEESKAHLVLEGPINFPGPVSILHGLADDTIPVEHVLRTVDALTSRDVVVSLIKGGDHRLSRPADLERLCGAVAGLSDR